MNKFWNCEVCHCRVHRNDRDIHEAGKKHRSRMQQDLQHLRVADVTDVTDTQRNNFASVKKIASLNPEFNKHDIKELTFLEPFNGCVRTHVTFLTPPDTLVQLQELCLLFFDRVQKLDSLAVRKESDFIVLIRLLYTALVLEEPWNDDNRDFSEEVRVHIMQLIELHYDLTDIIRVSSLSIFPEHFAVVIYNFFKNAPLIQSPAKAELTLLFMEKEISKWAAYEEMQSMLNNPEKLQNRIVENYENIVTEHIEMYRDAKASFEKHTDKSEAEAE